MIDESKMRDFRNLAEGLDIEKLRNALLKIDSVGWSLSHNLSVPSISLDLDEALNLSALLNRVLPKAIPDQSSEPTPDKRSLEYALSIWQDTRGESITREQAAEIAEEWKDESIRFPCTLSRDFHEGWSEACKMVAMNLRFRDFHL